ncbi:MAG: hypothetical protein ACRCV9_00635 [Burkholderiaceae bacterium]
MNQLAIDFTPPRARRTDPATSHEAALSASTLAAGHRARLLLAIREAGRPVGATELAHMTGLTQVQVCRRLNELGQSKLGASALIKPAPERRKTASGRDERTWVAA